MSFIPAIAAIGFAQEGETARVTFTDGAVTEADIVVAADGIHSELRPFVVPPSQPVFPARSLTGAVLMHDRVPDWPTDRWLMWLGNKALSGLSATSGQADQLCRFRAGRCGDERIRSAPGDPEVLRREFAGWDPRIEELLRQVQSTFRWALYDREPLPAWTRDRLTLLGDAAHPMLPHLGQGANQSIEDGILLPLSSRVRSAQARRPRS